VSSLICDRWLTCKLATFMVQLIPRVYIDSADMTFGCAAGLDLQRTSEKGLAGKALQRRPGACHAAQYICTP